MDTTRPSGRRESYGDAHAPGSTRPGPPAGTSVQDCGLLEPARPPVRFCSVTFDDDDDVVHFKGT